MDNKLWRVAAFLCVLCISSVLQAEELRRNIWGGSIGIASGGDSFSNGENSVFLDTFLRHYFKKSIGVEFSLGYTPRNAIILQSFGRDVEPPVVIRYMSTGYNLAFRGNFVYTAYFKQHASVSFLAGLGSFMEHDVEERLDVPPEELVSFFPPGGANNRNTIDLVFGATGEFNLTERLLLSPRFTVGYTDDGVTISTLAIGLGYRF